MTVNAVISLTTDFGVSDGYVAAMKGVIMDTNPAVQLVDISHHIPPQNVFQAAFVLSTVYRHFPHSAVHLVVVDPGVGTNRQIVILKTPAGTFIAPDNGVLSHAIRDYAEQVNVTSGNVLNKVKLADLVRAVTVTNTRFFRQPLSDTFHGRDIMAPVAALLAQGVKQNYTEGSGMVAVIGSTGYLEIALKGGNAASLCNVRVGNSIKIRSGA